jgi:hypothetical protein
MLLLCQPWPPLVAVDSAVFVRIGGRGGRSGLSSLLSPGIVQLLEGSANLTV